MTTQFRRMHKIENKIILKHQSSTAELDVKDYNLHLNFRMMWILYLLCSILIECITGKECTFSKDCFAEDCFNTTDHLQAMYWVKIEFLKLNTTPLQTVIHCSKFYLKKNQIWAEAVEFMIMISLYFNTHDVDCVTLMWTIQLEGSLSLSKPCSLCKFGTCFKIPQTDGTECKDVIDCPCRLYRYLVILIF